MPKHYRPPGKKKEGNAARYITRSQAVKSLQVSLSLLRKLCILKGIFPREPKKKVKGNHHTYYHLKDIMFLRHEPLLEKFREMRAYEKKVKKAMSKKNRDLAERLLTRKPTYTLDMLIRERYPTFIDALRDLDDCLSIVHLFAALPAIEREKIEVKRVHNCRRLSHEWQAYISRTHKLRKIFISVKGIYYQAEVEGQKITWLTPHALQQVLPVDVDFKVMLTFLEFYETLLAFINFRIYHSINVKYPPILDPRLEALAADLYALSRYFDANTKAPTVESQAVSSYGSYEQGEDKPAGAKLDESELRLAQLQHQLPSNEPGALMHLVEDAAGKDEDDEEAKECKNLFKNKKFFLSREVPRESLLFVIPAFGGVVSWEGEGAPFGESDQRITYQVAVLKEHFSSYGDLSTVELEDLDSQDGGNVSETSKCSARRISFMTRRAAERAFLNGKCWQGHDLQFVWLTSSIPTNCSKDVGGRESPLSSKGPSDANMMPTEEASTGSGKQPALENEKSGYIARRESDCDHRDLDGHFQSSSTTSSSEKLPL